MIKKVALLVGLCVCLSSPAMSADGPYLGINVGVTMPRDSDLSEPGFNGKMSFDSGFAFGAAVGQKIGMGRIEGEIEYKKADLKTASVVGLGSAPINGDTSVLSFMTNGYIDVDSGPTVRPYIMAGLGAAKLTVKSTDIDADENDTVFAYQVGVGCGFALNETVTFDVGYRYMGTSDADFNGTKATYGSHNLLAGIRFKL